MPSYTVFDVIVALGLLGLTFGMMFLVTVFGTRPPRQENVEPGVCRICEDEPPSESIGQCSVCEGCASEYFPAA